MRQARTRFKSSVLVDNVYTSPVESWLSRARRKVFWIIVAILIGIAAVIVLVSVL